MQCVDIFGKQYVNQLKGRMYGSQGARKTLRAGGIMANVSSTGRGKPLKAFEQGNLKAQCEAKYEEIKV